MSDNEEPHPKKKVTAATTDAPQEEFISQENIPSKSETDAQKEGVQTVKPATPLTAV